MQLHTEVEKMTSTFKKEGKSSDNVKIIFSTCFQATGKNEIIEYLVTINSERYVCHQISREVKIRAAKSKFTEHTSMQDKMICKEWLEAHQTIEWWSISYCSKTVWSYEPPCRPICSVLSRKWLNLLQFYLSFILINYYREY